MGKMMMTAACALAAAGAAQAQRVSVPGPGAGYPPPGPQVYYPPLPPAPVQPVPGQRWGGDIEGRWWGGAHAPGGWEAYQRPRRGYRLPTYWAAPGFRIYDWSAFGLPRPPAGYAWSRYYDDAVLIDARGDVYDTVAGVDWDVLDRGFALVERDEVDRGRRDRDGVAGAVAGAVAGGVAGNLVAGRGNRLGGTLIGGGLGAAAGYALGSGGGAHRPAPRFRHREPLPQPAYDEHEEHHRGPGYQLREGTSWTSPDGRTTVTVTTGGVVAPAIYASAPPPGYGGGVTTVTVQTAPVVTTTTTTEIIEDHVTYTRAPVRRIIRKRVLRPRAR